VVSWWDVWEGLGTTMLLRKQVRSQEAIPAQEANPNVQVGSLGFRDTPKGWV